MRALRLFIALAIVCGSTLFAADRESVLIRTPKPYDKLVKAIEKLGGTVTMQYKYVDGIAASIPLASKSAVEKLVGAENLAKDEIISIPESNGAAPAAGILNAEAQSVATPADYVTEAVTSKVSSLHAAGYTGNGIIIAVIDSGYRPMFTHVAPSRVLQGVSFVPTEPNTSNNNSNYPHGTQVAGTAAANIAFCFGNTVRLAVAARDLGAGQTGTGAGGNGCATTSIYLPMLGSAPLATIYPVKIFPFSGAGSPSSRTLQAMEHVLAMRQAYDADHSQGLNIKVLNMSLGGPTTYAGRSMNDQMVEKLLAADIVPVISAGNEGFASITTGSPGTSMGALTVGAGSPPINEWIYRAQFSAPCSTAPTAIVTACAQTYRPDANIQMAYFSSRGPTHDGRVKPDVIANGSYVYTQGSGTTATTVSFASGTSFSSPETAGIAASLRQAVPSATARQIRNAIIMSANPNLVPAATPIDQGKGYVDAAAALALLQGGGVPDTLQTNFNYTRNLQANMAKAGRTVYSDGVYQNFTDVTPSETAEIAYQVPKNAGTLNVRVHNIEGGADQNAFFGDDVFIAIQNNTVHDDAYVGAFEFLATDKTYTFTRPAEGIWRIVPTGDWTNKGPVSFGVDVWTTEESSPQFTAKAKINEGEQHAYNVTVPAGTATLQVNVSWQNMSANYPINDIDVALVAPGGAVNTDCATGKAPEACSIANPAAGVWTVVVDGFSVIPDGTPGGREMYTVRVAADNVVLH